jgi:hypothetical protein
MPGRRSQSSKSGKESQLENFNCKIESPAKFLANSCAMSFPPVWTEPWLDDSPLLSVKNNGAMAMVSWAFTAVKNRFTIFSGCVVCKRQAWNQKINRSRENISFYISQESSLNASPIELWGQFGQ